MYINTKLLSLAAAVIAAAAMAGCASSNGSNGSAVSSYADNTSAAAESTAEEVGADPVSESRPSAKDGRYIMQAYDFFKSESYSISLTYTDSEGNKTDIFRAVEGDNYYQLQTNKVGSSGSIRADKQSYDFDLACGIYRKSTARRLDSLVESVVDEDLPATSTHIDPNDAARYAVEEYTYTGSTYITVIDFYFDKDSGVPVKYTTHYMVEEENGDESRVETRVINDLYPKAFFGLDENADLGLTTGDEDITDETVTDAEDAVTTGDEDGTEGLFDIGIINKLVDYDSMTSEQRQGFCAAVFVTAGIGYDELAEAGFTRNELGNMSYDDFTALFYEYGFAAENEAAVSAD